MAKNGFKSNYMDFSVYMRTYIILFDMVLWFGVILVYCVMV